MEDPKELLVKTQRQLISYYITCSIAVIVFASLQYGFAFGILLISLCSIWVVWQTNIGVKRLGLVIHGVWSCIQELLFILRCVDVGKKMDSHNRDELTVFIVFIAVTVVYGCSSLGMTRVYKQHNDVASQLENKRVVGSFNPYRDTTTHSTDPNGTPIGIQTTTQVTQPPSISSAPQYTAKQESLVERV